MLNRLTVNALLKSAVLSLASAVVIVLALGAWSSWSRLAVANRIANVANASAYLFTGLHNLRLDRSTSVRSLMGDAQNGVSQDLRGFREAEMPALKAGLSALREVDLPDAQNAVPLLERALERQAALHAESTTALSQPKAARRTGLVKEIDDEFSALMVLLDKISAQLTTAVKLDDAFVGQMMQLKQLAWLARNSAGDASVVISNTMSGMPLPADALMKYSASLSRAEGAWGTIEEFSAGLPLPARFTDAIQKGKQEFFGAEVSATRLKVLRQIVAGEKPDIKLDDWVRASIAKLSSLLNVAEVALETVKDYAVEQRANAQWKLFVQLGFLGAALVLALSMTMIITRRVIAPLQMIQGVMLKLASGDFNVDVPRNERRDEVGQIVSSVNTMVNQIRTAIAEIKSSAREVTNASAEISGSTTDLSQRTEEQAASLEETSASMEEISATVKKNAENARHASQSASATKDVADRGGQVVAQAVQAMVKIEDSSRKISDIIGVIDEIARQTNLLALNAAVEAARAGEAGRGFAVVASEVRSLAQRSSQAAKDIKDLITNSNSQVKDGVDLVNRAGEALSEIVASIKSVADIVADIATASSEQATGIDEVNKALTQMDGVTQQNSALVEENAATAKTLEHQAQAMDEQVAFFQFDQGQQPAEAQRVAPVAQPARRQPAKPARKATPARKAAAA
jgi:methyl-accepting chemotaxis protein